MHIPDRSARGIRLRPRGVFVIRNAANGRGCRQQRRMLDRRVCALVWSAATALTRVVPSRHGCSAHVEFHDVLVPDDVLRAHLLAVVDAVAPDAGESQALSDVLVHETRHVVNSGAVEKRERPV